MAGRKGSKKVRTGCRTCKKRKVKCDEQKPACMRCIETRWTCEGYTGLRTIKNSDRLTSITIRPLASLSALPDLDGQGERRCLQFFCDVTAPRLAYECDDESSFWTGFVRKVCYQDQSVRHAALAVGGLYESLIYDTTDDTKKLTEKTAFALQQYNKAMSLFRAQLSSSDDMELLRCLSICTLFVCLEFLQKKKAESLVHLAQARRLINTLGENNNLPQCQIDLVRRYIVPMYTRLGFSGSMFGLHTMPIPPRLRDTSPSQNFDSLQQASQTLYLLIDDAMRWRLSYKLSVQSDPRLPTDFSFKASPGNHAKLPQTTKAKLEVEQQELLTRFSQWDASFAVFMVTCNLSTDLSSTPSVLLLQVHSRAISTWTATALAQFETEYDKHLNSFSALVSLCGRYLEAVHHSAATTSSGHRSSQPKVAQEPNAHVFSFETGVYPALYFVIGKCRHPQLSRAALSLFFRYGSRQENLWCASEWGHIAARHVKIETEAANKLWGGKLYQDNPRLNFITAFQSRCPTENESPPQEYTVETTGSDATCGRNLGRWRTLGLKYRRPGPANDQVTSKDTVPLHENGNEESSVVILSHAGQSIPARQAVDDISKDQSMGKVLPQIDDQSFLLRRSDANFGIPEFLRVTGAIFSPFEQNGRWVKFFRRLNIHNNEWESWDEFMQFD